jgi:hypothetical protein
MLNKLVTSVEFQPKRTATGELTSGLETTTVLSSITAVAGLKIPSLPADCDERTNRWLVLQLNSINLRSFFYKEISLRTLLLNSPLTYVLALDDSLAEVDIMICATADLPESYLPKENSFYNEEKYTEFALTFKTIIANNRIYDVLNEILKEVNSLKKSQNSAIQLLNILLNPPTDQNRFELRK